MSMHVLLPIAYIDPGSGSLMLQLLIGSVLGGLLFARNWLKSLWNKITRRK